MKETLYTIPLNDAFMAKDECPFCFIERNVEQDLLDFTLGSGSSYMESDVREATDKAGFCRTHFKKMFDYGNTLGNGWILKTHYVQINKELKEQIQQVKNEMDSYIWNIKQQAVKVTKQVFGFAVENDLLQELKEYQKELSRGVKNSISSRKISKFWNGIQQLNTHNENEIVEKISKILLDLYIEDWKENGLQQYEESLKLIKTEMESVEERAEEGTQTLIFTNSQGIEIKKYYRAVEVEGTSRFFQNELEDTLEDYADSLETNQKIAVMLQMIEKLLEG